MVISCGGRQQDHAHQKAALISLGRVGMRISGGLLLSLLATVLVGIVFVMMVGESLAVERGEDPITNKVRAAVRRYPRLSYVVAVLIGLILGHLFWQ